ASVPIAATLVTAGMPPGAALVFLMAGPATNVATLGAVYRTLGLKTLLIYLTVLIVGSVGCGLLLPSLIDIHAFLDVHHHDHPAWWQITSTIVLSAALLWFAVSDFRRLMRRGNSGGTDSPTHVIRVEGMTCQGCASRLERSLNSAQEIDSASVTFRDGEAVVQSGSSRADIAKQIRKAGFQTPDDAATPDLVTLQLSTSSSGSRMTPDNH
ncbi:MAG: cation transporter, partial [Planctomycetaceae bacterium]|nr:cation transporter [Planctomycetaceae bacterium]